MKKLSAGWKTPNLKFPPSFCQTKVHLSFIPAITGGFLATCNNNFGAWEQHSRKRKRQIFSKKKSCPLHFSSNGPKIKAHPFIPAPCVHWGCCLGRNAPAFGPSPGRPKGVGPAQRGVARSRPPTPLAGIQCDGPAGFDGLVPPLPRYDLAQEWRERLCTFPRDFRRRACPLSPGGGIGSYPGVDNPGNLWAVSGNPAHLFPFSGAPIFTSSLNPFFAKCHGWEAGGGPPHPAFQSSPGRGCPPLSAPLSMGHGSKPAGVRPALLAFAFCPRLSARSCVVVACVPSTHLSPPPQAPAASRRYRTVLQPPTPWRLPSPQSCDADSLSLVVRCFGPTQTPPPEQVRRSTHSSTNTVPLSLFVFCVRGACHRGSCL